MKYYRVEIPVDHVLARDAEHAARIAFDAVTRAGGDRTALVFGADEYSEAGDAPIVIDLAAIDAAKGGPRMSPQRIGFAARAMGHAFESCPYLNTVEANQWRAGWRIADESLPSLN